VSVPGRQQNGRMPLDWTTASPSLVVHGDNLDVTVQLPDGGFTIVYLDPPFNTGRQQRRRSTTSVRSAEDSITSVTGFKGVRYERIRGDLMGYDDRFEDYWSFRAWPRPGGCSPPTARSTCTSTTARRTTRRCCSTPCSGGTAS
jgi:site-specific DNA-methyltransferase (adenine-specific)